MSEQFNLLTKYILINDDISIKDIQLKVPQNGRSTLPVCEFTGYLLDGSQIKASMWYNAQNFYKLFT